MEFRKSKKCDTGSCVEVAMDEEYVYIRNSDLPDNVVVFTRPAWQNLVGEIHTGQYSIPEA